MEGEEGGGDAGEEGEEGDEGEESESEKWTKESRADMLGTLLSRTVDDVAAGADVGMRR